MRRWIWLLLTLIPTAIAQQFEVASIRPSGPNSVLGWEGGPGQKDPTRYSYGQATMMSLIYTAWGIQPFQVSSSIPLDRDKFDLIAKVPEGATKEQFRVMMQSLLKERFGLKIHMEKKEFPAYELVVAKSGLKLTEGALSQEDSRDKTGWPTIPPDVATMKNVNSSVDGYWLVRVKGQLQPMSVIAGFVHPSDNLPVVDRTGLTGKYSFALEYVNDFPGPVPDGPPPAPTLFIALQKELGLQLASTKLPFDVVVVESFNRSPTEN